MEIKLVCSVTENYLPNAEKYFQTVNSTWPHVTVFCVDFEPGNHFDKYEHISAVKITPEENKGAPERTHSIQHGSFIWKMRTKPTDTIVYTDTDLIMQRPFSWEEQQVFKNYSQHTVGVGWNSGPNETLMQEGLRLRPKVEQQQLTEMWGPQLSTEPCFNIGVVAARPEAWQLMYKQYMFQYDKALESFGHEARQQWLMCYVMAQMAMDRRVLPTWTHAHAHYGLPPGVFFINNVACYQDRIICFRHRF